MRNADTFILTAVVTLSLLVIASVLYGQTDASRAYFSLDQSNPTSGPNSNLVGGQSFYFRSITVDNSNGDRSLTDYQIKVIMDTATLISQGKMQSDCSDMMFYDSDQTTQISKWTETGCNTATTTIWVKVPFIPQAEIKTIYVYYGHPDFVSTNSPNNIFDLYDDFGSLRASWTTTGGVSVTGGHAVIGSDSSGSSMDSVATFSEDVFAETRMKFTGGDGVNPSRSGFFIHGDSKTSYLFLRGFEQGGGANTMMWNTYDNGWSSEYSLNSQNENTYGRWRIYTFDGQTKAEYLVETADTPITTTTRNLEMGASKKLSYSIYNGGARRLHVDWTRVRKYTLIEPIVTVNPDENTDPTSITTLTVAQFLDRYEWCNQDQCTIAGSRNANSTIPYSYANGNANGGADWRVTRDGNMGRSLKSGGVNDGGESRLIFRFTVPQQTTQNAVYSLSFDYMVSADSADFLTVFLTKKTGPQAGPLDLAYAQGIQCIHQGGDNGVNQMYRFNQVNADNNPCTYIMAGEYTVDFVYKKDDTITIGKDAAFIDNLKIDLIPIL